MKWHLDKILPVLLKKKKKKIPKRKSVLILHDPNAEFTIRARYPDEFWGFVRRGDAIYGTLLANARREKPKGLICSPWKPERCPDEAGLGCLFCNSMYNGWDFQGVGVQMPKTDAHRIISHFWKVFGRIPNYMEPIHSYTARKQDATDLMVCSRADIWFVFVELSSLLMACWSRMGLNEKGKVIHRKMA